MILKYNKRTKLWQGKIVVKGKQVKVSSVDINNVINAIQ